MADRGSPDPVDLIRSVPPPRPIIGRSVGTPRALADRPPSNRGEPRFDRHTPGTRRHNADGTCREHRPRQPPRSNRSPQPRRPRPSSRHAPFRMLRESPWDAGPIGRRRCGDRSPEGRTRDQHPRDRSLQERYSGLYILFHGQSTLPTRCGHESTVAAALSGHAVPGVRNRRAAAPSFRPSSRSADRPRRPRPPRRVGTLRVD